MDKRNLSTAQVRGRTTTYLQCDASTDARDEDDASTVSEPDHLSPRGLCGEQSAAGIYIHHLSRDKHSESASTLLRRLDGRRWNVPFGTALFACPWLGRRLQRQSLQLRRTCLSAPPCRQSFPRLSTSLPVYYNSSNLNQFLATARRFRIN